MLCCLLFILGCTKPGAAGQDKLSNTEVEPHLQGDEPPTVVFDLKEVAGGSSDGHLFDCVYQSGGKTARFRLLFKQNRPVSGQIPMAWAEGKFLSIAGSENSVLLGELKKALDAKRIPPHTVKIPELPFDAVILGERQSRSASGGFSNHPPGDWQTVKLFFPKGGDDGEVFFNLNPVLGKGEFSIKDSDYGDYLLAELSKVL